MSAYSFVAEGTGQMPAWRMRFISTPANIGFLVGIMGPRQANRRLLVGCLQTLRLPVNLRTSQYTSLR